MYMVEHCKAYIFVKTTFSNLAYRGRKIKGRTLLPLRQDVSNFLEKGVVISKGMGIIDCGRGQGSRSPALYNLERNVFPNYYIFLFYF